MDSASIGQRAEAVVHRGPGEIMDEIAALDAESAAVLAIAKLRRLVINWLTTGKVK